MKNRQTLLKEFYNYFYTIYSQGDIGTAETRNIVDTLMDYHFSLNDMDVNNYEIIIHLNNSLGKKSVSANMKPDMKYYNKYHVSIDPKKMNINKRVSFDAENYTLANKNELLTIIFFLTTACHEFQHIVQFEKMPILACHSFSTLCDIAYTIECYKNSKDKKYLKLLNRYYDVFQIYSDMEKDADKASYNTLYLILEKLINMAVQVNDEDFAKFLGVCYDMVLFFHNDRKVGWKRYSEFYKKVKKEMKDKYGLETSLT